MQTKAELIALVENLERRRCPLRHGGSCDMNCHYHVSCCYGEECLFGAFAGALENDNPPKGGHFPKFATQKQVLVLQ